MTFTWPNPSQHSSYFSSTTHFLLPTGQPIFSQTMSSQHWIHSGLWLPQPQRSPSRAHLLPLPPALPNLAMGMIDRLIAGCFASSVKTYYTQWILKNTNSNCIYTHGIWFSIINIHDVPLSTATFIAVISSSRPTGLYFALENPARKSNARPASNIGTCRVLTSIILSLSFNVF